MHGERIPRSFSTPRSRLLRRMDRNLADLSACVLAEIPPNGGGAAGIFNSILFRAKEVVGGLNHGTDTHSGDWVLCSP